MRVYAPSTKSPQPPSVPETRTHEGGMRLATIVALVGVVLAFAAAPALADSPWELLRDVRQGMLDAGPVTGTFEQTFIPAGFNSGDTESGNLSLWLPTCLRWNYLEPEEKHFLLCDDEVWSWNDLEPAGRHYVIDPAKERGLDLLLVDVDRLRERYIADSERLADGTFVLHLSTPTVAKPESGPESSGSDSFSAEIHIDPVADRVRRLEYTDGEGNRTRFDIRGYQKLEHTALFMAPRDLEWTDE